MTEKEIHQSSSEDWHQISEIASRFEYPQHDVEAKWKNFSSKLYSNNSNTELKVTHKSTLKWKSWAVAAMLFMALGFGFYLMKNQRTETTQTIVYNSQDNIKNINLEDGTKVTLNKNSSLTINTLNDEEREVTLIGEAVFEVTHNGTPFKVKANDKVINVLGTIFNVKNVQNLPFSLSLKEGKIKLEHQNNVVYMKPGESLKIIDDEIVNTSSKTLNPMAWINNKLEYKETSMLTIVRELEDYYNVNFEFSQISNAKLTVTFDNLNAEDAAELLSKVSGNKVTLKQP